MIQPNYHLLTFSSVVMPCKNYKSFERVYQTDIKLIERYTSFEMALTQCKVYNFKEMFILDNIGYERSQECLKKILNDRKNQDRETTNDQWTAFQHLTSCEYGIRRVTVVACRDAVDAMLFRMEWD